MEDLYKTVEDVTDWLEKGFSAGRLLLIVTHTSGTQFCLLLQYIEQEMDGAAISAAFATCPGPVA